MNRQDGDQSVSDFLRLLTYVSTDLVACRLWDVLGNGEVIHIADYAARYFKKHKRPLRVAVDEACWRYNNVNEEQVEGIRTKSDRASNPLEKNILYKAL